MKVFLSFKIARLLVLFDLLGCKVAMAQLRDSNATRQRRRLVDVSNQGNNGSPTSAFPLGKCQGDCDTDNECAANLKCYQRNSGGAVPPGCSGTPTDSTDYCYDPNDSAPPAPSPTTLRIAGDNGSPSSVFPLGQCQGDCDTDSECAVGLVCFQRSAGQAVPGCRGTPEGSKDYCIRRNELPAQPAPSPPAPVPVRAPVPVPVRAPVPSGNLVVAGDNGSPSTVFPLQRCQGDCDDDNECAVGLVCFQRSTGQAVPGCRGTPDGSKDYCVRREDLPPTLTDVGDNYDPRNVFPLGRCEGDCDGDSDCAGELVCHQREEYDPVPSCAGRGVRTNDYCVRPSDETARPPVPGSFRLKLYWEAGVDWQEEFWEREWCMQCTGSSCDLMDQLRLYFCGDTSTWFVYRNLNTATGQTQIQVAKSDLCIDNVGNQRVELRTCVDSSARQKFVAGNGSFGGDKFELETVFNANGCLSNHHHPKENEIVYRNECITARDSDTSFWNQY